MDEQRDLVRLEDAAARRRVRARALPKRRERWTTVRDSRLGDQWSVAAADASAPPASQGPVQTAARCDGEPPPDTVLDVTAALGVARPVVADALVAVLAALLATGKRLSQARRALPPPLTAAADTAAPAAPTARQPTQAVRPPPPPAWRSWSACWQP